MGKTGLIVEGGGMKCAYSAGILDKFLDDSIAFDYCIGVSAGAANTLSYLPVSAAEICVSIPYILTIRAIFLSAACFAPEICSVSSISTAR